MVSVQMPDSGGSATTTSTTSDMAQDNTVAKGDDATSRLKRTACVLCRKRKLKCDAARPKCSTCHRLGHECEYNEVRKKSGPKRGYVKALEARLASVETQLKTTTEASTDQADGIPTKRLSPNMQGAYQPGTNLNPQIFPEEPTELAEIASTMPSIHYNTANVASRDAPFEESYSWDMIALGLDEPLPTAEAMNELYELYFKKVHPSTPMIHRGRFLAALSLGPGARPPVALRYAMWTLAAGMSDQYQNMQDHFYHRARKYIQQDEMRSFGEGAINLYFCQAWILLSIYEFKNMHFPRAWLSTGRATRSAQMLGLHRLDGEGLAVKTCLEPPKDWTEREERRRTFWMAFWEDRCASIGTGWPMTIDERDILTNLPASDEAFESGQAEATASLEEILSAKRTDFANFGGAVVLTALFGRNLHHLHRSGPDDREDDLNGGFWERHRMIDAVILNINMNLPDHQRIPLGLPDPNIIYVNMCIQTSVICLHQAAIFKIDKHSLPVNLSQESKIRCVTAAAEIATLMRSVSHCELAVLNPFTAFCLYVACRVFIQYMKSRPNDQNIRGSLDFLLSAMHAMKRRNPLNESFLAQLEVDLEGANIKTNHQSATESLKKKGIFRHSNPGDRDHCTSVIDPGAADQLLGPEPSTTIPTNMQPNIGSSNTSEMSLPTYHQRQSPHQASEPDRFSNGNGNDNCIFDVNGSRTNSVGVEEMDCSPATSGNASTPGMYTHRSGSTGGTEHTPPDGSASDGSIPSQNMFQNFSADKPNQQPNMSFWGGHQGVNGGNTQAQNTNFYHFSLNDGPSLVPRDAAAAPSPMSQQEFESLTKQFFPPTPGGDLDSWIGTGMTPAGMATDDWKQILEGMSTWDNNETMTRQTWDPPAMRR